MNLALSQIRAYFIALLMLATAIAAWFMHPRILMSDQRAKIPLEQLVPTQFGDWNELLHSNRQIVNPQQTAILDKLYSETLARVYINSSGAVVMLSLAYGANQSRDLQIHRPEVCYSAQGFHITETSKITLSTTAGDVPAMRLVAKLGQRTEPVTYWVRIGEKVVRGNLEQGFARLNYGLNGVIADGILFRVSVISGDTSGAYAVQTQFVEDLLTSVPSKTKAYLLGEGIF